MKAIRWGIVGAGRIAHTFCSDARLVDSAEIVAVASRSLDNAQQFSAQHQINTAYGSYEALYADPNVDAIYIATPHNFHFPQCQAALNAGKHVLCEKPFTVSAEECQQLTKLATDKQLFLMEAMWTHYLPAIRQALSWYQGGRIGEIVQITADFGYPIEYAAHKREYNAELAGGCLREMGIYPVSLVQLFMQKQPDAISVIGTRAPNGVEDSLSIQAEYKNTQVSIATSFKARLPNWAFIVGSKGYMAIPDFFRASESSLHVLDEQVDHFVDNRKGSGFEFQIQASCEHIRKGELQSNVVPLSSSLAWQQQMEHILRTFAESRPVN